MSQLTIKLDANERQGQPARWLTQALAAFNPSQVQRYPDDLKLKQTLARALNLQANQVDVFNGGDEAIACWGELLRAQNARVLLPTPTFSVYPQLLERIGLTTSLIEADTSGQQSLSQLMQAIESAPEGGNNWLVLVNPNNPTGQYFSKQQLADLLLVALRCDVKVLLDEAYIEFADIDLRQVQQQAKSLVDCFGNLLILRTFSKAYGLAGVRVGYLVGQSGLLRQVKRYRMPYSVNQLALSLAQAALEREAQTELQGELSVIKARRNELIQRLTDLGLQALPSQANFVSLNLSKQQARLLQQSPAQFQLRYFDGLTPESTLCRITIPQDIAGLLAYLKARLKPEIICLDMDGVLIDVRQSYDQCVCDTVLYFSDEMVTPQQVQAKRNQTGCNDDWKISQLLLQDLGYQLCLSEVTDVFQRLYLGNESDGELNTGLINAESPIINGALKQKLTNYATAIVTSRPRAEAELGQTLVDLPKAQLVSRDDAPEKPQPDGIRLAAQNANAQTVWMVGDNRADIQAALAARNAGLTVLAIGISAGDNQQQQVLLEAGADLVLDDVNQIGVWL